MPLKILSSLPLEVPLLSDIYIHLPVSKVQSRLPFFLENGWQPELALQTSDLDCLGPDDISSLRTSLSTLQLKTCIHAPFFDLNPASNDKDIKEITSRRFRQTLDFAAELGSSRIIFHPGFDPWRYARTPGAWLNNSLEFWPPLIKRAEHHGILLCLENIFDTEPAPLVDLLKSINSPHLRHCFDVGHWFLFSKTPLCDWFDLLGPFLSHLHLHDNRGRGDDHRPIGSGKIDFPDLFSQLKRIAFCETATLEAQTDKDAERSLKALLKLQTT